MIVEIMNIIIMKYLRIKIPKDTLLFQIKFKI